MAGISAETLAVLRRHNLLMPLLVALVTEGAIAGVEIVDDERNQLACAWRGQMSEEDALAVARNRMGWSADDLEWQLLRPARISKVARERFGSKAEARFLGRKNQLDHVQYSLLRTKDGALAKELYLRLVAGEASFADLAQTYSEGPERRNQGSVGPRPLSDAHPLLAERLRTAQDGKVLEPFRVEEWWLIARRDQLVSAAYDEKMSDQMSVELFQEWVKREAEMRLASLSTII